MFTNLVSVNGTPLLILLEAVHDWAKALEYHDSCHCLCLDFAKAFDSVLQLATVEIKDPEYQWPVT